MPQTKSFMFFLTHNVAIFKCFVFFYLFYLLAFLCIQFSAIQLSYFFFLVFTYVKRYFLFYCPRCTLVNFYHTLTLSSGKSLRKTLFYILLSYIRFIYRQLRAITEIGSLKSFQVVFLTRKCSNNLFIAANT